MILALETSGYAGSVAVLEGDKPLTELPLDSTRRSAASLAPALAEVLGAAGCRAAEVRMVAVTVGPGSFTSLRVGVTTAKAFAYAVGAQVIAINTLEAIAAEARSSIVGGAENQPTIAVAIDAQRGDVYAARFRPAAGQLECLSPAGICAAEGWLATLEPAWLVTGPAVESLLPRLPSGIAIAPRERWFPSATTVGRLAAAKYATGQRDDLWSLTPLYLRRSAAEEKHG